MNNLIKIKSKDDLLLSLENYFDTSSPNEIYTIIKILLGGLRVGVSNEILKESLSKIGARSHLSNRLSSYFEVVMPKPLQNFDIETRQYANTKHT